MATRRPRKDPRKRDGLPKRRLRRERGLAIPPGSRVVYQPAGVEKMSEVLEDFVSPYRDLADDLDTFTWLLQMGILAWNIALLPGSRRRAKIDKVVEEGLSSAPAEDRARARELIEALVRRKEQHFAANQRAIHSFELKDTGRSYHLSVLSSP